MVDVVNISTGEDTINLSDPTTNLDISISEETINVGDGLDVATVTPELETIQIIEVGDSVSVNDVLEEIPALSDNIIIQVVEDSTMPYAKRTDFVGETLIYKAEATVGSVESDPVWRIRRLTIDIANEDDITEEWASGNATFDKVWDDHLTLVYS